MGSFQGDVFFYGSERSFGPLGADNAALFTHAKSTGVINEPDGGELDIFFNADRETVSDPVILNFLNKVFS